MEDPSKALHSGLKHFLSKPLQLFVSKCCSSTSKGKFTLSCAFFRQLVTPTGHSPSWWFSSIPSSTESWPFSYLCLSLIQLSWGDGIWLGHSVENPMVFLISSYELKILESEYIHLALHIG